MAQEYSRIGGGYGSSTRSSVSPRSSASLGYNISGPGSSVNNNCYILISCGLSDSDPSYMQIPCYPESVSESTDANYGTQSPLGRISPIYSYINTGARSMNFSFTLHREMIDSDVNSASTVKAWNYNINLNKVISYIRSSVYPHKNTAGLFPTITTFIFGKLAIRGIVRSVQFSWSGPIIDQEYQLCTVSVSIDEIPSRELIDQRYNDGIMNKTWKPDDVASPLNTISKPNTR